jgi:hypothetical protein
MYRLLLYKGTKVVSWQNKLGLVETVLKLWGGVTKTGASREAIVLTSEVGL